MKELMIDLDVNAKTALYEQIYQYIKHAIVDGKLSYGERLPSTRLLAKNLQISRSTVESAYGQLASEGYLQSKQGSGYYVCDIGVLRIASASHSELLPTAGGKIHPRQMTGKEMAAPYTFMPGLIDSKAFPYNAWRKVNKEALLELETEQEMLLLGHPQGEYRLRQAIAFYLYQARGVRCVPEQILIGAGNEYLLQLLGQILGDGQKVAMESPTYLQAYHTFQNMGYEVTQIAMDDDGMLVGEIKRAQAKDITLAYVMPSHQFPMGTVMPIKRRRQLLEWAEARPGRYIIEDDYDSEFRYVGRPIPSLHSLAQQDHVIYLGTFTNSIMPSIRISYMILPPQLLHGYYQTCGFYASTVARSLQLAVCKFMEGGYFERHLNRMRGIYKGKHDELLKLLKGKSWVERIYGDRAGLHIAVEIRSGLPEAEIIKQAKTYGIAIQGMSGYYIAKQETQDKNPVLLLGFGNLSEDKIREGIARLEICVLDLSRLSCK